MIGMCYAIEERRIPKWWSLVVPAVKRSPVEWANVPMDQLQANGVSFYGGLFEKWQNMADSSKPPFGKTLGQWRAFCGDRTIRIATLLVQVPYAVDQAELNRMVARFDYLCDLGVYVGGSWANLIGCEGAANLADSWNVVKWLAPYKPSEPLKLTPNMMRFV